LCCTWSLPLPDFIHCFFAILVALDQGRFERLLPDVVVGHTAIGESRQTESLKLLGERSGTMKPDYGASVTGSVQSK
jgi:hypothetical protein